MVLKGSLSHWGKNRDELRAMGHDLIKLWKEFKGRAGDDDLNKFDEVISALNEFEAIRYPGAVVKSGMAVLHTLNRAMSGAVPSPRPLPPQYNLYLQEIDELVGCVFTLAGINPDFFTGGLNDDAKAYLTRENPCPGANQELENRRYQERRIASNIAKLPELLGGS
jgi:hypothetical protein